MSGSGLSPGDIVLIMHTPLDDPSATKARPAIVVSGSAFNNASLDVILVAISSVVRYGDPRQVVIQDNNPDFPQTGLKVTSAVKCAALFAYPKSLIRRRLGRASKTVIDQVRKTLVQFLTDD